MTRVNVGILPSELCDQMLLAEIRELPRCFAYPEDHPRAPREFTLGTGHVLWCARYKLTLEARLGWLLRESRIRNFNIQEYPVGDDPLNGKMWTTADMAIARPLLIARISERLTQMKREPRWTNRTPPEWALPALEARKSIKCDDCNTDKDVERTHCPYAWDIHGKKVSVNLCPACRHERAQDI